MNNMIRLPFDKIKDKHLIFTLLWMTVISTFAVSHGAGGLDTDSCNYAVVAKEILRSNQWLNLYDPVYGGFFYYHFPLAIWVTAVFFKLFGISAFTAKLFSMSSILVLVCSVFYLGKLLKNSWVGFFAGLSLLMTNHVLRLSMQCRMDIPVTLFITLAILSFLRAVHYSGWHYISFGLFSCLAIFTKDVFGLAPLAIAFIYLIVTLKWSEFIRPMFILGCGVAILPVVFWIWLDKGVLFSRWWQWNFLHLLSSPSFHVPWYYYIWVLVTKYFYFLPFAGYGVFLALGSIYREHKSQLLILLIWAVFFPLAFSFGRQKLHYFILPIYPAMSVLVGISFDKIFRDNLKEGVLNGLNYILIFATLVLLCFPLDFPSRRFAEIVRMGPVIDQFLKDDPAAEFIVYKYDTAAVLFYTQKLSRVDSFKDIDSLAAALERQTQKERFCFITSDDFQALPQEVRERYRIILQYQKRTLLASRNYEKIALSLDK